MNSRAIKPELAAARNVLLLGNCILSDKQERVTAFYISHSRLTNSCMRECAMCKKIIDYSESDFIVIPLS